MNSVPFELGILGPTELHGANPELDAANLRPPKRLALLAYLALETANGFRRRDQIVALFWPDLGQDAARAQLRKALGAFRESLGADAIITRGEGEVRLDSTRVSCDAVLVGDYLRQSRAAEALALYRGQLLDGLFPEGVAQEFEEWLDAQRKHLREQAAAAAWECSRAEEERGDGKAAAAMARRALALTPDDEDGVRRLMTILDRYGDRGGALRAYSEWQSRLQAEYGVEPAPETRKLARRVQAARRGESHETPPVQAPFVAAPRSVTPPASTARDALALGERGSHPLKRPPLRAGLAIGAAALLIMVLIAFVTRQPTLASSPSPLSIAVLPLRAIGGTESAAEGVTEEITTALATTSDLLVHPGPRGRDSSFAHEDPRRTGERLGVAYLVDGAVQRAPRAMRVTVRLIRASDGVAVWALSYVVDEGEPLFAKRLSEDAGTAIHGRIREANTAPRD